MNAKIMKGKSAGGLIDYLNSMKEKNAKVIFSNGVSTTSNRTVVAAFNLQWANSSSKIKDKMGHLVISFSPKDRERLTDEFITELCKEYMQRMKFPPTIYLGYRHLDQEHDHVHIAYSRIDNEGKAITCDSNYARSVNVCKSIRAKYGLSAPSKRKKDVNRDRLIGKDKVKYHIMDIAFPVLDKAGSWKEYISRLKSEGVDITMVRDGTTNSQFELDGHQSLHVGRSLGLGAQKAKPTRGVLKQPQPTVGISLWLKVPPYSLTSACRHTLQGLD